MLLILLACSRSGPCPDGMRHVPAGGFISGADRATVEAADWPERWNLPRARAERKTGSYCIDRYEYPNHKGTLPRVYVTWEAAAALCAEQGKRLCTEDEWTRACSGDAGQLFPYGDTHEPGRCNDEVPVGEESGLQPAGSRPRCESPFGVMDMDGNASEWVADAHELDPDDLRVVRGGTMWLSIYGRGCMSRHAHDLNGPTHGDDSFRCCSDAP